MGEGAVVGRLYRGVYNTPGNTPGDFSPENFGMFTSQNCLFKLLLLILFKL